MLLRLGFNAGLDYLVGSIHIKAAKILFFLRVIYSSFLGEKIPRNKPLIKTGL